MAADLFQGAWAGAATDVVIIDALSRGLAKSLRYNKNHTPLIFDPLFPASETSVSRFESLHFQLVADQSQPWAKTDVKTVAYAILRELEFLWQMAIPWYFSDPNGPVSGKSSALLKINVYAIAGSEPGVFVVSDRAYAVADAVGMQSLRIELPRLYAQILMVVSQRSAWTDLHPWAIGFANYAAKLYLARRFGVLLVPSVRLMRMTSGIADDAGLRDDDFVFLQYIVEDPDSVLPAGAGPRVLSRLVTAPPGSVWSPESLTAGFDPGWFVRYTVDLCTRHGLVPWVRGELHRRKHFFTRVFRVRDPDVVRWRPTSRSFPDKHACNVIRTRPLHSDCFVKVVGLGLTYRIDLACTVVEASTGASVSTAYGRESTCVRVSGLDPLNQEVHVVVANAATAHPVYYELILVGLLPMYETPVPPVPPDQMVPHPNGGGLKDVAASVDAGAFVGPGARVYGNCVIGPGVRLLDSANVTDCRIDGDVVFLHAADAASCTLSGRCRISGNASLRASTLSDAIVAHTAEVRNSTVADSAILGRSAIDACVVAERSVLVDATCAGESVTSQVRVRRDVRERTSGVFSSHAPADGSAAGVLPDHEIGLDAYVAGAAAATYPDATYGLALRLLGGPRIVFDPVILHAASVIVRMDFTWTGRRDARLLYVHTRDGDELELRLIVNRGIVVRKGVREVRLRERPAIMCPPSVVVNPMVSIGVPGAISHGRSLTVPDSASAPPTFFVTNQSSRDVPADTWIAMELWASSVPGASTIIFAGHVLRLPGLAWSGVPDEYTVASDGFAGQVARHVVIHSTMAAPVAV